MPKVRFSTDIQSISGKLCSKEGVIYSVNKQTGETYRSDRHSHHDANTAEQQTVRADFKKKAQFAAAWWKQNRPVDKNAKGTEAYLAVMKAYKAQHKNRQPLQLHALPRHRRPQGPPLRQRPHGWREAW